MRLRNGLPAVTPDRAAAYAAAASQAYHSFRGLPEEAWPLFLSAKQYLHMLDGEQSWGEGWLWRVTRVIRVYLRMPGWL